MKATFGAQLLALLMLCCVFSNISYGQTVPSIYHLGIFPYMVPRQTIRFYGPVAASMEKALGRPVKLESQRSFTDFTNILSRHAYDIALIQPFDYPQVVDKEGYIPLAQLSVPLVTQFFVRDNSKYHTLSDLRGTLIAMPPVKSANARMAVKALIDNKMKPGVDVEIRFFNSHDSCLQQVWAGTASACSSAIPPVKVFQRRMKAKLRPIYKTKSIPHVLFVADPRVPPSDRDKLRKLIIGWKKTDHGRKMLHDLGFPGFKEAAPQEYAVMQNYDPLIHTASASIGHTRELVLGIFPFLSTRQILNNFAPLVPALTKTTGITVGLRTSTSFGSYSDNLVAGKYDIVLIQAFEYQKAIHLGYAPLAAMKNMVSGSFYVRVNSSYQHITDFKGKIVAMPPSESTMAVLGRNALRNAGLKLNQNVTIKYLNTHDACLKQVQRKIAAACVTTPFVVKGLPDKFSNGLRKLGKTLKSPGAVFLANQRLPEAIREKIKQEILSWQNTPEGKNILNSMQLGAFGPVNPDIYNNLSALE